jgi:large subunit ribosomal protein L4
MQFSMRLQAGGLQTVELSDAVFACDFNEALVHQVVTASLANIRQGTRAQKSRAEVRGGGRKPWRQKGTGRARAGDNCSIVWRGGGVAFAAKPRRYTQKVNRKMYRGASRSIFSSLLKEERLVIVDAFTLAEPKTKALVAYLKDLEVCEALIVSHEFDETLYLAARNLPNVMVCSPGEWYLTDLIRYQKTIITLPALQKLEEQLI